LLTQNGVDYSLISCTESHNRVVTPVEITRATDSSVLQSLNDDVSLASRHLIRPTDSAFGAREQLSEFLKRVIAAMDRNRRNKLHIEVSRRMYAILSAICSTSSEAPRPGEYAQVCHAACLMELGKVVSG
jgi:hypothetical protein